MQAKAEVCELITKLERAIGATANRAEVRPNWMAPLSLTLLLTNGARIRADLLSEPGSPIRVLNWSIDAPRDFRAYGEGLHDLLVWCRYYRRLAKLTPSALAFDRYAILAVDGHAGIYGPQECVQAYRTNFITAATDDLDTVEAGPNEEFYWEAWENLVADAKLDIDGHLWEGVPGDSGDIWLVRIDRPRWLREFGF